jgi:hypothetical protein
VNRALDIEHLDHRAISNSGFGFRQFQVLLFWSHRACSFVVVANRRYSVRPLLVLDASSVADVAISPKPANR